ncbi:MAG: PDZ domain-containing protein [bacterium]
MKSHRLIEAFVFACLVWLPWDLCKAGDAKSETKLPLPAESLLRVNSTNQVFDFLQPWIKKPPFNRRGLGVVLDGGRILVTAELIANSTYIELEKPSSAEKSPAFVERVDYDCNLAVLKPTDPAFLDGLRHLPLDGPLHVGDEATILQLEPNGDVAQTAGRITSISVGGYPSESMPLLLFKLGVPLQQRDGSFTLPAVRDGCLIGMVMRYDNRNQSADVVPTPVIRHFLSSLDSAGSQGFARLGLSFSPLRDPQLRRYLGLKEPGGVYVTEVTPRGSATAAGIKKGDVLLAVDGLPIDQDGNYEDPDFGRILFSHFTNTVKTPGTTLSFQIFRDGAFVELPVLMKTTDQSDSASPIHLADEAPKYAIVGGLVFTELSRPYLKEWGMKWTSNAPQRLVYYDTFPCELPADRGRIVILSQVLPTADSTGYEDLGNLVVTKLNGRQIKSIADLSDAVKHPMDGFHKIEFEEDPKIIFLDAASVEANKEALKMHYSLPALERL